MNGHSVRTRGLLAASGLLIGYLLVGSLLGWGAAGAVREVRAPGPAGPGSTVALAAALGAAAALTWLTGLLVLVLASAAVRGVGSRAHARAVRLAPRATRRLAASLLGLAVVGAPIAAGLPAAAAVTATAPAAAGPAATALPGADRSGPDLDRPAAGVPVRWTPDRPAAPPRRATGSEAAVLLVTSVPRPAAGVVEEVVVRRGDTLWAIAARHLGPGASAAEVAAEWPRWHRTNRAVIGPDPDLLRPGERLLPPRPR